MFTRLRRSLVCLAITAAAAFGLAIGTAPTTADASVITGMSGVAHPGYFAHDSQPFGIVDETTDFWTGAVTTDRRLYVPGSVIYAGTNNPAAYMVSQVTVQRYTKANGWGNYLRAKASNSSFYDDNNHNTWSFRNQEFDGLPSGYYRVYVWYWFMNAQGGVIGKMTEWPEQRDYSTLGDGGVEAWVVQTPAGTAGSIALP